MLPSVSGCSHRRANRCRCWMRRPTAKVHVGPTFARLSLPMKSDRIDGWSSRRIRGCVIGSVPWPWHLKIAGFFTKPLSIYSADLSGFAGAEGGHDSGTHSRSVSIRSRC